MISAVIFDLDGTVIDTEGLWEEVFQMVKMRHKDIQMGDLRLPNGWFHEPGMGTGGNWKKLVVDREMADQLARETWTEYAQLVQSEDLKVKDGVEEAIEKAKERKWLTALCTGTPWHVVEKQLEELGMMLAFDVTTTGEEVDVGKPDPAIYLLTAQKLGAEPTECLVVEDSAAGVQAAAEAGMRVIGLLSDYAPIDQLKASGAEEVVESWDEIGKIFEGIE